MEVGFFNSGEMKNNLKKFIFVFFNYFDLKFIDKWKVMGDFVVFLVDKFFFEGNKKVIKE